MSHGAPAESSSLRLPQAECAAGWRGRLHAGWALLVQPQAGAWLCALRAGSDLLALADAAPGSPALLRCPVTTAVQLVTHPHPGVGAASRATLCAAPCRRRPASAAWYATATTSDQAVPLAVPGALRSALTGARLQIQSYDSGGALGGLPALWLRSADHGGWVRLSGLIGPPAVAQWALESVALPPGPWSAIGYTLAGASGGLKLRIAEVW